MPHPEVTVPKFGDWDNNDLSYSVLFDKARADKERFLPSFKDGMNDPLSYQNSLKQAPSNRPLDTFQNKRYDGANERFVDVRLVGEAKASKGRPASTDNGYQQGHMPHHERRPSKPESEFGQRRQSYQSNPTPARIARSQQSSEGSRRVEADKTAVPKFGEWDASNAASGEGFTVIFNRARDEKKLKATTEPTWKPVSPLRPDEDLYQQNTKSTALQKKQRGWLNMMCCMDAPSKG